VKDGAVTVGAGDPPAAPDIGVTMTVDTWRKIRRRELNAQAGVMTGQIRIKGNLGLAIKLGPLFN